MDVSTPHIHTPKRYDFCDVLVIGAVYRDCQQREAAGAGADVVIVDENVHAGGAGGYQLGGSLAAATNQLLEDVKKASAHPSLHRDTGSRVLHRSLGTVS
jgi:sarcosine oxidase subunit alpha